MEKLIELTRTKRIPLSVTMESTYRCNFKCKYCFQNSLRKDTLKKELSVLEWKKVLSKLAKKGCLYLVITGGELCMKEGIEEIYEYAYKLGYIIDLQSNLSFLNKSPLLDKVKQYKPNTIIVTIYGDDDVYENFCGIKNGWNKVKENILELKNFGIDLRARSVFHNDNIKIINKIKEFITKNKIPINVYSSIMTDCNLITKYNQLNVSENSITEIYKTFNKGEEIKKLLFDANKENSFEKCSAGLNSFYINPYGEMFLCPTLLNIANKFNIKDGFENGWNNLYLERIKYIEKSTPCDTCPNKRFCGTCNATYIKEYNSNKKNLANKCKYTDFIKNNMFENEKYKKVEL